MTKKRKSGGRKKGQSGKGKSVQCAKCHRIVPIDKARKETRRVSVVDRETERMIRKDKGYVSTTYRTSYYCVSCAIHTHKVNIRSKSSRDLERSEHEQKRETQEFAKGFEQKEYGERKDERKKFRRDDISGTSKRKETSK